MHVTHVIECPPGIWRESGWYREVYYSVPFVCYRRGGFFYAQGKEFFPAALYRSLILYAEEITLWKWIAPAE